MLAARNSIKTNTSSFYIKKHSPVPKRKLTLLIVVLWFFNILLKASYALVAPFLPAEAASKGVSQELVGFLFVTYSISFALTSVITGRYLSEIGRRNFLVIGALFVFVANTGFVILHFLKGKWTFIIGFTLMRLLQGAGTGFLQTANYAILSVMYPNMIEFVCGWLEAAAGIGLCFGPVIGVSLFELGGYTTPFIIFAIIFLLYGVFVKFLVPKSVDFCEETDEDVISNISYVKLLSNKRILFASFAIVVNVSQDTFIDPLLADRLYKDFGYDEVVAGMMFSVLGLGYAFACQFAYKTLNYLSYRRWFFVFFIINGFATTMYGPSEIFGIPKNIYLIAWAMLLGGLSSSHTIIPAMPEIIEAGENELNYENEILTDFASGLFNFNFAIGEVVGPLAGNELYVKFGMPITGEILGLSIVLFAIIYFLFWDVSLPWNSSQPNEDVNDCYFELLEVRDPSHNDATLVSTNQFLKQ